MPISKMPTHPDGSFIFWKRNNKVPYHGRKEYFEVTCSASSGWSDFNHPRKAFSYPFLTNLKKKKEERKSERYFPLLLQESLLGVSVWENERCSGNGW